jgi:hypothetical protein
MSQNTRATLPTTTGIWQQNKKIKSKKKIRRRKRQGTNIGSITSTHKQTK